MTHSHPATFEPPRHQSRQADMPIKCPVAPIELAFLADYFFHARGLRERVRIDLVTPLSGAFTKPISRAVLGEIARRKNIGIIPDFSLESVDGEAKKMRSFDGRSLEYDLLVSIPPNLGPRVLDDSGLGDGTGYGFTDRKSSVWSGAIASPLPFDR